MAELSTAAVATSLAGTDKSPWLVSGSFKAVPASFFPYYNGSAIRSEYSQRIDTGGASSSLYFGDPLGLVAYLNYAPGSDALDVWANSGSISTLALGTALFSWSSGGLTGSFLNSGGLRIWDTNASHTLRFAVGSDLTANRTFTLTTGNANRTLDISAGSVTFSTYGITLAALADAAAGRTAFGLGALSTVTPGTGVATALAINVGSAGAVVLINGALGTPSSGTLTSCTGLPVSTGISGLAAGIATFLATPSSANLLAAVTDETGTGALVFGTTPTLATPVINGLPTGTGVTASITASTLMSRDTNANSAINNLVEGFTTTATAAGTTTLTITATYTQIFTGSSTQTVKLPTTSVLQGQQYLVINQSTGAVTVQSSGANTIKILAAGTSGLFTAVIATPTTAANWDSQYASVAAASGKVGTFNNTLVFAGTDATTMTFPATSATIARTDATNTFAGTQNFATVNASTEYRFGGFSFSRLATVDAGGAFGGGYNVDWNNGGPRHDSTGPLAGAGNTNGGIYNIYTNTSQTAGTAATISVGVSAAGAITLPRIGTTASAANAFIDNGASNSILRSTSSRRYKKDIRDLALEDAYSVLKLRPVTHRSKAEADDPNRVHWAFIAEEADETNPQLVNYSYLDSEYEDVVVGYNTEPDLDADGEPTGRTKRNPIYERRLKEGAKLVPDGFQYDRVVVGLVAVVKDLAAEVAELKRRLAA